MALYITDLAISTTYHEEEGLKNQGFSLLKINLNEGTGAGNDNYVWFKRGDRANAITRVQVTYHSEMETGMDKFIKLERDINTGTTGVPIHMWFSRAIGDFDNPILDLAVTTETAGEVNYMKKERGEWEKVGCNLNLDAGGKHVYLWVKREKPFYICDVIATVDFQRDQELFSTGYTRVDESTNLTVQQGKDVFIWYRRTSEQVKALSALNISITPEKYAELKRLGYDRLEVNLNENTGGSPAYLWYKSLPNQDKVKRLVLLLNWRCVEQYKAAGINVIERNLNTGNTTPYRRADATTELFMRELVQDAAVHVVFEVCSVEGEEKRPKDSALHCLHTAGQVVRHTDINSGRSRFTPAVTPSVLLGFSSFYLSQEEDVLKTQGFTQINVNLNEGTGAANKNFLWYKKGEKALAITRVQVTYNRQMESSMKEFTMIDKNINTGTSGGPLYMWFSKAVGEFDIPIMDVAVTTETQDEVSHLTARGMWENVDCNLNLGAGGNYVYAWMKRENPFYICDVTATTTYDNHQELFSKGFTRVDISTNLGALGQDVFIWYRKTSDSGKGLSALNISTNPEQYEELKRQGYHVVDVNLNENTGPSVYLWYNSVPGQRKVQGLFLLLDWRSADTYKKSGINVIERNLNTGKQGDTIYLCDV
ncbi:hypothetical protein WMY93_020151 [Mugilogobius chulae]|uniref:MABP domain-containing protein n=1 Tax=Mugilogobius chulae TaxID=88201 RepID=A0AAW0NJ54_9GOBI